MNICRGTIPTPCRDGAAKRLRNGPLVVGEWSQISHTSGNRLQRGPEHIPVNDFGGPTPAGNRFATAAMQVHASTVSSLDLRQHEQGSGLVLRFCNNGHSLSTVLLLNTGRIQEWMRQALCAQKSRIGRLPHIVPECPDRRDARPCFPAVQD
jgi:hypothetical protein